MLEQSIDGRVGSVDAAQLDQVPRPLDAGALARHQPIGDAPASRRRSAGGRKESSNNRSKPRPSREIDHVPRAGVLDIPRSQSDEPVAGVERGQAASSWPMPRRRNATSFRATRRCETARPPRARSTPAPAAPTGRWSPIARLEHRACWSCCTSLNPRPTGAHWARDLTASRSADTATLGHAAHDASSICSAQTAPQLMGGVALRELDAALRKGNAENWSACRAEWLKCPRIKQRKPFI